MAVAVFPLVQQIAGTVALIIASRMERTKNQERKRMVTLWRLLGFGLIIGALSFNHVRDAVAVVGYIAAMFGKFDAAAAFLGTYHTLAMGDVTTPHYMVFVRMSLAIAALLGVSITSML